MSITEHKIDALRHRVLTPERKGGALLVVYPPEEELQFRSACTDLLKEFAAKGIPVSILDFRPWVFELLESKKLLEKAFQLDAAGSRDLHQNIAGIVQRETVRRLISRAEEKPEAIIWCTHTAALYPWISYSALLEEIENVIRNTVVIPFPGSETGPALHFLGAKDGYNYRAARI